MYYLKYDTTGLTHFCFSAPDLFLDCVIHRTTANGKEGLQLPHHNHEDVLLETWNYRLFLLCN